MIQSKANSTKGQKWDFANRELMQNVSSALMIPFLQMRSTERHSQAIYKRSAPHLSLRQSQPHVWALQSKFLPEFLLFQGFCICLCTLECISWLLGLACSAVHSQAVKRKFSCPSRNYQGKQWEVLKTNFFPHLLCAEQQLRASLLPLTIPASGISLSQSSSRWKGSGVRMKLAEKTVTGEKSTFWWANFSQNLAP